MIKGRRGRIVRAILGAALLVAGLVALLVVDDGKEHLTTVIPRPAGPASASESPARDAPLEPRTGVVFGSSAGTTDYTQGGRIAAVDALQARVGFHLSVIHIYRQNDQEIGTPSDEVFLAQDRTLLISWTGTDTRAMAAGQDDAAIEQRAREVAAIGKRVFFEYRWEMDRPNLHDVVHSPGDYIAAWNRVRSVFAAQQVTNAEFVWCPLANGFGSGRAQPYYPGDAAVDWICADVYPPQVGPRQSFAELAGPFLAWTANRPKPIIFGEFGVPASYGARRPAWLRAISAVVRSHPRIKAFVYFNSDSGQDKYSLSSDAAALDSLTALARTLGARVR